MKTTLALIVAALTVVYSLLCLAASIAVPVMVLYFFYWLCCAH
jgi:hypothetical protein